MTLNVPGRYIVMLNVLLVAAIAYFAALAVSDLFALRLASNAVPPANIAPGESGETAQVKPRGYYELIVRRDIFNLTPAAAGPVAQTAAPEDEDLRITLLGTSHVAGARPFAIIEDQDGDQVLYQQGDVIPDAGQLIAIGHDRAVVGGDAVLHSRRMAPGARHRRHVRHRQRS